MFKTQLNLTTTLNYFSIQRTLAPRVHGVWREEQSLPSKGKKESRFYEEEGSGKKIQQISSQVNNSLGRPDGFLQTSQNQI